MARIWANRLEAGTIAWDAVPDWRSAAVKAVMQQDAQTGRGGMNAERYEAITGEKLPEVDANVAQ